MLPKDQPRYKREDDSINKTEDQPRYKRDEDSIDETERVFKALGQANATRFEGFETFPAALHLTQVSLSIDDVTALCPITNQPDFYSVDITYKPALKILETKTVKLYLASFRDEGIFAEDFASIICEAIQQATLSPNVSVMLRQHTRGGIETTAFAEIELDDERSDDEFKQRLEGLRDNLDKERLADTQDLSKASKQSGYELGDMHFEDEYQ